MPYELYYDAEGVRTQLEQLDHRSRVAFTLSCAERMLPNYATFTQNQDWGSTRPFRQALDTAWAWLITGNLQVSLSELIETCVPYIPDTEDFQTILVSSALDAANSAIATLELVETNDPEKAMEVSQLSRDTVDMYVQELEDLQPASPDLEERIRLHPLMQRELARQTADLALLTATWNAEQLSTRWRASISSIIDMD